MKKKVKKKINEAEVKADHDLEKRNDVVVRVVAVVDHDIEVGLGIEIVQDIEVDQDIEAGQNKGEDQKSEIDQDIEKVDTGEGLEVKAKMMTNLSEITKKKNSCLWNLWLTPFMKAKLQTL